MAKVKGLKKKWIPVFATKDFNSREIGEVPCFEPGNLNGKVINVNLYNLIDDPRKQNSEITFKIVNANEKKADTEVTKLKILGAYIRRVIKKGKEKIDDSFTTETKDKIKIIIKPLMITKNKTNNSVLTSLRINSRKQIESYVKEVEFDRLVKSIVQNSLQREIRSKLKKTYPLSLFEIRELKKINKTK